MNDSDIADILGDLSVTELEKELAEASLLDFTKQSWKQVEPGRDLKVGFHMEALAEHLEAVTRGQIKKIVINVPPRTSKSTLGSVNWQPWEWIQQGSGGSGHIYGAMTNFMYVSAAERTATRDALKSRQIIESEWFQKNWGDRFSFLPDQNQKTSVKNNKGGTRSVFGITANITGENADRLVLDDPNNADDGQSVTKRNAVIDAWENKIRNRLNDIKHSAVVVIQQRIHPDDMTGLLTQQEGWEHLVIPMEWDGEQRSRTSLYFKDPRTEEGEVLDPERFPKEEIEKLKTPRLDSEGNVIGGELYFATQYQQRPGTLEGGLVKREWWKWYDPEEMPHLRPVCDSYDTAFKEQETNDPSARTQWGFEGGNHYVMDIWEGRLSYPDLKKYIKREYDENPVPEVLIEDKASGQSLVQEFSRIITERGRKIPVKAMVPGGSTTDPKKKEFSMPSSKMERVAFVADLIEAGLVWLPKGHPMAEKLVDQFANFPNVPHDDILDTVTQRLCRSMSKRRRRTGTAEVIV